MITYKQAAPIIYGPPESIIRLNDGACIPFAPGNTDYDRFKTEILTDQAQLEDPDGNPLSAEEAKLYVSELP